MRDQVAYWDRVARSKTFTHELDRALFEAQVARADWILDLGCGYGRLTRELDELGYRNVTGADTSGEMIRRGLEEAPYLHLVEIQGLPLPWEDGSFEAVLLFSLLTCVPDREDQRALLDEVRRVLRPGGVVYASDLGLQTDERNAARYDEGEKRFGERGVFELPEGVVVCHLDEARMGELRAGFDEVSFVEREVLTMNGNAARAFQFLGRKRV